MDIGEYGIVNFGEFSFVVVEVGELVEVDLGIFRVEYELLGVIGYSGEIDVGVDD